MDLERPFVRPDEHRAAAFAEARTPPLCKRDARGDGGISASSLDGRGRRQIPGPECLGDIAGLDHGPLERPLGQCQDGDACPNPEAPGRSNLDEDVHAPATASNAMPRRRNVAKPLCRQTPSSSVIARR